MHSLVALVSGPLFLCLSPLGSSQQYRPDCSPCAESESWLALGSAGFKAAATEFYLVLFSHIKWARSNDPTSSSGMEPGVQLSRVRDFQAKLISRRKIQEGKVGEATVYLMKKDWMKWTIFFKGEFLGRWACLIKYWRTATLKDSYG